MKKESYTKERRFHW